MSKKYQYGRDLHSLLIDGMVLSMLIAKTKELRVPIEQSLMLHNIYERFPLKNKKERKKNVFENVNKLKSTLSPQIHEINQNINLINKVLKGLNFKHKIQKLKIIQILDVVDKRLKTILEVKNAQLMGNDLFHKSIYDILQAPYNSIQSFLTLVEKEKYGDELKKISEPYKLGIEQALDVCSIGYYTTAVFIAGRTMEELINNFYRTLFVKNKIERFDLSKINFENKINKLNSLGFIKEELYHSLSNIRIDRNKFGHPSFKILTKPQAHLKIRSMILMIPEIERKINILK